MLQAPIRLVLTVGEPAGIGPDIVAKIAHLDLGCQISAYVDPNLLDQRAQQLSNPIRSTVLDDGTVAFGRLRLLNKIQLSASCKAGILDVRNARYVYKSIQYAAQDCLAEHYDAMVTAPVHKGIINQADIAFSGHTELIANVCGIKKPVMMLANQVLRIALVTTHLPLKEVTTACDSQTIAEVISVVHDDLKSKFGISSPRIRVCGLNPHAGEEGYLGREEIDSITPCLQRLRADGIDIVGPVSADTAFVQRSLQQTDCIIAMYHDQGLPVIKALGFGEIVNITLGLPIIRTSVDHGTALDLAGTGRVDEGSLIAAIEQARQMVLRSQ